MLPHPIIIFTDGASRGNPGPGGFAAIIILPQNSDQPLTTNDKQLIELGGGEERTTNNRMELRAATEALKAVSRFNLSPDSRLNLYSDSSYLVNGITKWIFGWQKNGWQTGNKKDVENRDLWEKLLSQTQNKNIEWRLVSGHAGVAGNERCDEIATAFADGHKPTLYQGLLSDYPIKNILDFSPDEKWSFRKTAERGKTRQAAYSYVSLVGGVVQTHKTWAECLKRVKGKRAKYKKVFSKEEEEDLLREFSNFG
ncbi:MAG: Ribonuclease H [Parcubacteria group bacterium GW2011_GWA2_47_21]|nr:MAG: Ribonuclease H [Parcubacteria group bacterium GW2011_GWA2_47_21]